jgi:LysR family transcriptional regulator, hydrogen peroxide-inducible genes activator
VSEMVAIGLGIALFPALYVQSVKDQDLSLRFLPLKSPSLEREVGLAWRTSSGRAKAYEELGSSLVEIITKEFGYLPKVG